MTSPRLVRYTKVTNWDNGYIEAIARYGDRIEEEYIDLVPILKNLCIELGRISGSRSTGWGAAAFAIVVWCVTFASTRSLLEEFSALEILVLRFALAWTALRAWEVCILRRVRRARSARPSRSPASAVRERPLRAETCAGSILKSDNGLPQKTKSDIVMLGEFGPAGIDETENDSFRIIAEPVKVL